LTAADALCLRVVGRERAKREHARETERYGAACHLAGNAPQAIDSLLIHMNLS